MILAGQFDKARVWDLPGQPAAFLYIRIVVAGAMKHERRNADSRQNMSNVDLRIHPQKRDGRTWTCRSSKVRGQTANERFISDFTRDVVLEVHLFAPFSFDQFIQFFTIS